MNQRQQPQRAFMTSKSTHRIEVGLFDSSNYRLKFVSAHITSSSDAASQTVVQVNGVTGR
jgi:hypothetical protein